MVDGPAMIDAWNKLMEIPEAKWIVIGTLLLFIVLIGIYVVTFFRNLAIGSVEETDDFLTGFRQMRDDGQLDEDEFSRLKQSLPGNGQAVAGVPANKQPFDAGEKPEKRFMTLAEAQRQKQEQTEQNVTEKSDSGDRVEEHE